MARAWPLVVAICIAIGGAACAPTNVQVESPDTSAQKLPRPSRVLVYDFAVSPDEVKLDQGISGKVMDLMKGTPRSTEEIEIGHKVADALSKYLVEDINKLGLPAKRASGEPSREQNALMIRGQFVSIDEGNQAERMVVGLGLGRTEVEAHVQVVDLTPGSEKVVETLEATAQSGAKPGAAEMAGVGAVAGHLLVSAAVSTGVGVASEAYGANVEADARRMADQVTKQLSEFFASQGWIAK